MKYMLRTLLLLAMSLPLLASVQAGLPAPVVVPEDVFADYQTFLAGRDPLSITDFTGPGSRRDVVELVLLQQAIAKTDMEFNISFVFANFPETLEMVKRGDAIATANTSWRNDLMADWDQLFITTSLIDRGEFVAGFYTTPSNRNALAARVPADVFNLRGVSSRNWTIDWATLDSIPFVEPVAHADTWGVMTQMVLAGESDFLLAPFQPNEDMVLELGENNVLVPIPNLKIGLAGTRNMAVSRAHPHGGLFNAALHQGLLQLKQDGIVRQAYEQSGFLNTAVNQWTLIQAENVILGF